MKRSLLLTLVTALFAVGLLAGCGGDDDDGGGDGGDAAAQKEEFDKAYGPINDELLKTGDEVGQTIQTARGKSNSELASSFSDLNERTEGIKAKLDDLEPPPEYEQVHHQLSNALAVVAGDLKEISEAATAGDAGEARTQAQELVRHSVAVRTARRELARKTGATVEGGAS